MYQDLENSKIYESTEQLSLTKCTKSYFRDILEEFSGSFPRNPQIDRRPGQMICRKFHDKYSLTRFSRKIIFGKFWKIHIQFLQPLLNCHKVNWTLSAPQKSTKFFVSHIIHKLRLRTVQRDCGFVFPREALIISQLITTKEHSKKLQW